jgi:thiamine kinase-like enzyme
LGAAHGDFAPWNLLATESGWTLLDWEIADQAMPPFYDLFHFLVQANGELRRPSKRAIVDGLNQKGWVGAVIQAYGEGSGIEPKQARTHFLSYLQLSSAQVGASIPRQGLRIRRRLAEMQKG